MEGERNREEKKKIIKETTLSSDDHQLPYDSSIYTGTGYVYNTYTILCMDVEYGPDSSISRSLAILLVITSIDFLFPFDLVSTFKG